jgi:riboflavin synthase alpha subunit
MSPDVTKWAKVADRISPRQVASRLAFNRKISNGGVCITVGMQSQKVKLRMRQQGKRETGLERVRLG